MAIFRTTECRKSKSDGLSCDCHDVSSGSQLNSLFWGARGGRREIKAENFYPWDRHFTVPEMWEMPDRTVALGTSGSDVDRPRVSPAVLCVHKYVG